MRSATVTRKTAETDISLTLALDGSGRAPAAATPEWYAEHGVAITPTSPHAVTVPGAVGAWDLLVRQHGTRSLGELLFCDQAFKRGALQVCHYPRQWLPAADQADALWGRRSRFERGALSVLVAEVFLPNLWAALSARSENN